MNPQRRLLSSVVDLRPGEGPVVVRLIALAFFCGFLRIFVLSAATPIFLTKFPVSDLPYTYLGTALLASSAGVVQARVARRLPYPRLLVAMLAFLLGHVLVLRACLELPGRIPAFLVISSVELVYGFTAIVVWGLANRLFDVRQAKRVFGPIGNGGILASVLGGLMVPVVVKVGGIVSLLVAGAVSAALALLVLRSILRRSADGLSSSETAQAGGEAAQRPTGSVLRDRHAALVVGYAVLCTASFFFVDAGFVAASNARYADKDALASFMGLFFAVAGLATVTLQTFVAGPVLKRFGVRVYLILAPVVVLAGSLAVVWGGVGGAAPGLLFALVVGTRYAITFGYVGMFPTSKLLLLQPLPARQRSSVQSFSEAIAEPLAVGATGGLILLLTKAVPFTATSLAALTVPALAAFFVIGVLLGRSYASRLAQAIETRVFGDASIALDDAGTLGVLVAGLDAEKPGQALYCIDRLEAAAHPGLADFLARLLAHAAPEVRTDALLRIERLRPAIGLAAVERLLATERDAEVIGVGLRVLVAIGADDVIDRVASALDDASSAVRVGAMVGLLRHGGIEGVLAAGRRLNELGGSPRSEDRSLAARVIAGVGHAGFYRPLLRLLADADPEVRRAALEAAGRLGSPALWPAMHENLGSSTVGSAAVAALSAVGEPVLPVLDAALGRAASARERLALVRVCSAIRGGRADALLERALDDEDAGIREDAEIRLHALRALAERGRRPARDRVIALLDRERALLSWLGALRGLEPTGDLGVAPPHLISALADEVARARERVFLLLAALYEAKSMLRAHAAYTSGAPEQRAYALELLDVSLSKEHKKSVIALLEDAGAAREQARARGSPLESVAGILAQPSLTPWTRCCAVHALALSGSPAGRAAVQSASSSPDAIVRETVAWALAGTPARKETKVLTIEKVLLLTRAPMFADTPGHVLAGVAEVVDEVAVAAGHVIMRQGELGSTMFVVAAGEVRVDVDGKTIATLGPGDVIGELSTLDPQARTATVTATEECLLLGLSRDVLFELMAQRVEFAHAIVRFLIRRYSGGAGAAAAGAG